MVSHGGGQGFEGTDFLYLTHRWGSGLKFSIAVVVKIKNWRVLVEPPAEERWSGLLGRWLLVCSVAARCLGAVVLGGGAGKKPAGGHSPTTTQSSSAARRAPCTVQCNCSLYDCGLFHCTAC